MRRFLTFSKWQYCELPQEKLSLCRDVVGRLLQIRSQKMAERNKSEKQVKVKEIIKQVADETMALWDRSSIPSKGVNRVRHLIDWMWKEMDLVRKTKVAHGKPAERLQTRLGSSTRGLHATCPSAPSTRSPPEVVIVEMVITTFAPPEEMLEML